MKATLVLATIVGAIALLCWAPVNAKVTSNTHHHRQPSVHARHVQHHGSAAKLNHHHSAKEKFHFDDNAAPTASFQYVFSDDTTCTLQSYVADNYTTGVCLPSTNSNIDGSTWFCDSTGGYQVVYATANCTGAISLINKFDLGCVLESGGDSSVAYVCVHAELGPSPPFGSWPPPNSIVTSECSSALNGTVCPTSTDPGLSCTHVAVQANECIASINPFGGGWQMSFCTEDSDWIGVATYWNDDCSDPVPVSVVLTSTLCNPTTPSAQCTGTPLSPSLYPSAGFFSSTPGITACQAGPGSMIIYQQPSECFDFNQYICADGTSSSELTLISNSRSNCAPVSGSPPISQTFATNECLVAASGAASRMYFCDGYQN